MFRLCSAVIPLFLLLSVKTPALEYLYTQRLTKLEPGKPGNIIRCITTDQAGLIWLGTIRGLVRFNGFRHDNPADAIPGWKLPSTDVSALASHADTLFIATNRGLYILQTRLSQPITLPGYQDNGESILMVRHDPSSGFWWFREDGWLFHWNGKRLRSMRLNLFKPVDMRASQGALWVSGNGNSIRQTGQTGQIGRIAKLFRVDAGSGQVKEVLRTGPAERPPFMYEDAHTGLVYVHDGEAHSIGNPSMIGKNHAPADPRLTMRTDVREHRFLVFNNNRLVHEYPAGSGWKQSPISLGIPVPHIIFQIQPVGDRLLVSTSSGLITLGYRPNAFIPLRSTFMKRDGNYEDPRGIAEDSTHFYLTGYHTVSAYRKSDGALHVLNAGDLITHGVIMHERHLWLATEGNGLLRFDPITRKIASLTKDASFGKKFLISVANWGDTILVGGYRGFNAYIPSRDRFLDPDMRYDSLRISDLMIKKILPLDGQRCLIGSDKGIFIIDHGFRILRHLRPPDRDKWPGIDIINDLVAGTDGTIWAATFNGLVRFDAQGRVSRHITRREGLAGDFVASLVADREGSLWAGTYEGLSRVDTSSGEIVNYFREDGLPDDEFNHSSVFRASSGDILMGTVSGFIRFNPAGFVRTTDPERAIRISRVEYGGPQSDLVQLNRPYTDQSPLRITKEMKYLKLHFYADPTHTPEQSIYEYRIDGVHEHWINMGPTPVLQIDNARSGSYVLHVRFISGSGTADIMEQSFPLEVEQYFYTRPAFYIAIIGALLAFILLYVRGIIVRDRRLKEIRQELAEDLHDEIGGYLTGLSMNLDLIARGRTGEEGQMGTLRSLIHKAIYTLKDGLWSLDAKTDNAQQLWDRFKRITQESLEPLDIPYRFTEPAALESIQLTVMEKRNLLFTFKESLTNAIKHGDGKGVWLDWQRMPDGRHLIQIRNGISPHAEGDILDGHGRENIGRRMRRIHGMFDVVQDHQYYCVTIKIQLKDDRIRRN